MRRLFQVLAFFAFAAGIVGFYYAFNYPRGYNLTTASAIQATQVYAEATYYGVLAITALVTTVVLLLAAGLSRYEPPLD